MPKYLFTYRMPLAAYQAPPPVSQDEAMAPWVASFAAMGSSVVDPGQPVAERTELGEVGPSTVWRIPGKNGMVAGSDRHIRHPQSQRRNCGQ